VQQFFRLEGTNPDAVPLPSLLEIIIKRRRRLKLERDGEVMKGGEKQTDRERERERESCTH
jgi:hypothetical protein